MSIEPNLDLNKIKLQMFLKNLQHQKFFNTKEHIKKHTLKVLSNHPIKNLKWNWMFISKSRIQQHHYKLMFN
jgi:hypothetical protein